MVVMVVMNAILPIKSRPQHTPCGKFHHPKMQLLSRLLLLLLLLVKVVTMLVIVVTMLTMLATLGNALAWLCSPQA